MMPLYIFDLDGTIADVAHRRYLVQCEEPDWRSFDRSCVGDSPNLPVVQTFHIVQAFADVMIWSGRSDDVRAHTLDWLEEHLSLARGHVARILRMRRAGDNTPDDQLKESWLRELPAVDRARLVAVFDDRQRVVNMWRANGVPCFQVAPGDF